MELMAGAAKIDFAFGAPGLEYDNTATVTKVSGQAAAYGIKAGWSIVLVNGEEVTTFAEAKEQFQRAIRAGKKYPVTFMKDANAIRVEQAAKEQKEQEKKNAERAAKQDADRKAKEKADAEGKAAAEKEAKKQEYWDAQQGGAGGEGGDYKGPDTSAQVGASGNMEEMYMQGDKGDMETVKKYKQDAASGALPEQGEA